MEKRRNKRLRGSAFILLTLMVVFQSVVWLPGPVEAATTEQYEFVSQIPERTYYFGSIMDVEIDQDGNVYVLEYPNEIKKYDSDGNLLTKVSSTDNGNIVFNYVGSIDLDSQGNIYLSYGFYRVIKMDSDFNYLGTVMNIPNYDGDDMRISDIAVDGTDNLFVFSSFNERRLYKITNGSIDTNWGTNGYVTDPDFETNSRIAVDKPGLVYVAIRLKMKYNVYDFTGTLDKSVSTQIPDNQFHSADGIDIDDLGNVYITDSGANVILKFDMDGNHVATFGESGMGDGQFDGPDEISVTGGKMVVFDSNNQRIQHWTTDGTFLSVWGWYGSGPGQFYWLKGITIDDLGNVYVVDYENHRIQKFDAAGNFVREQTTGTQTNIHDMAVGTYGQNTLIFVPAKLYVNNQNEQHLYVYNSEVNELNDWFPAVSQYSIQGIGVGPDGKVYITDRSDRSVKVFDENGQLLISWIVDDGSFLNPRDVDADSNGNVYVTFPGDSQIRKYSSTGDLLDTWTNISLPYFNDYFAPYAMDVDSDNNVYVTDNENNAVLKFDSEGNLLAEWNRGVEGENGVFDGPEGIAVAPNGYVYVSDTGMHRIQIFRRANAAPPPQPPQYGPTDLMDLTVSSGTLTPAFDKDVTDYTVNVGSSVDQISVTATVYDPTSTMTVSGDVYGTVQSGVPFNVPLNVGSNIINITVMEEEVFVTAVDEYTTRKPLLLTAAAGASKTYTVDIRRATPPASGGSGKKRDPKIDLRDVLLIETEEEQTHVALDTDLLDKYLEQEDSLKEFPVEPETDSRVLIVELTEEDIDLFLEHDDDMILHAESPYGSYDLPLGELDLEAIKEQLGQEGEELTFRIIIEALSDDAQANVRVKLGEHGLTLINGVVGFEVQALQGDVTITIESFGSVYVNRTIPLLNEYIDPDRTTGVMVDPETGSYRFVPTIFEETEEGWTAILKREGNSFYTIVTYDKTFDDIQGHPAQDDIELLASKLIVFGMDERSFVPEASLTRAQYAALLVRALGLQTNTVESIFSDVPQGAWYARDVTAAGQAGLILGYEDGTFRPNQAVTREELAVMLARAIRYVERAVNFESMMGEADEMTFEMYVDGGDISDWARDDVADLIQAGILSGRMMDSGMEILAPRADATRAEMASALTAWLRLVGFIN